MNKFNASLLNLPREGICKSWLLSACLQEAQGPNMKNLTQRLLIYITVGKGFMNVTCTWYENQGFFLFMLNGRSFPTQTLHKSPNPTISQSSPSNPCSFCMQVFKANHITPSPKFIYINYIFCCRENPNLF